MTDLRNQEYANFKPADIKALILKQGKATIGNYEYTLKYPQLSDLNLQAIINDPALVVRSYRRENEQQAELELGAKDKTIKLTLDIKTIQ
jgi:hypothetical protein